MTTFEKSSVIRETEKALLIKACVLIGGGLDHFCEIWFPKSQIKSHDDGCIEVAEWLASKKLAEIGRGNSAIFI